MAAAAAPGARVLSRWPPTPPSRRTTRPIKYEVAAEPQPRRPIRRSNHLAYEVAASAASYVQRRARGLLSLRRGISSNTGRALHPPGRPWRGRWGAGAPGARARGPRAGARPAAMA
ncbi:hypothetical protein QYE76_000757 [Lolium multiflorum]|uniref:Uncharacterized protein n=1 Tax=Lolium multiflorum TaxID=4521 RepID=A0AAD8RLP6_LOLMU|nr:hypothetical protein QYE76_000757 [Lolium multiflorum]